MDPKDPDSGFPTPRDDEDDGLDETTQSQFIPMVTSTPKVTTRVPRLNLHAQSDNDRLTEEDEEYFSPDDEQPSSAELVKRKIQQEMTQRELDKTKSKYSKLQRENDDLRSEKTRLQTSLDTSIVVADDKDSTIVELNKSISILNETMSSQNELIQKQKDNLNIVTADFEVLKLSKEEAERELSIVLGSNDKFKKELVEQAERMHQIEEELKGAQGCANQEARQSTRIACSLTELKQQLNVTKQELEELRGEYDRQKQAADEKYALMAGSLEQSEDKQHRLDEHRKTELRELTKQRDELEDFVSEMKRRESKLQDENKVLQDHVSDYKKSCADWKLEADQCKNDIETLRMERNNLNADVCAKTAEMAQLTIDFQKMQLDLSEAADKLSRQTSELDSLKIKEEDFMDAVHKIKQAADQQKILEDDLQSKNIALKKQEESIQQLQEKVAEFSTQSDEFETFRSDYIDRIKLLTDANAQAKASVQKAQQMENQMINDQVQLKNEVSSNKNEIENLKREIAKLKEAERHLKDQLNGDKEVSELLTEEKQRNSQLSDKLSEYEKINRGLADENSYLRDHFGNRPHPVELAGVQQELDRKTLELEDIKKEKVELLNERERMNSDLLARMEELANNKTELEDLLEDIRVANEELVKQKDIIGKLVQEHNDFVEDAHERETEFEAAQIRLQQLEALDGYPGRSIEIDKHDESIGSRESKKMYLESLVREIESLRSTLDGERTRIRELNSDIRKKNNESRDLRGKLESVEAELRKAEHDVEHYRHQLNIVELSLTERDAQIRIVTAENSTNQLALSEMKHFLMVDNPRELHDLEQKTRISNSEVERLKREKIVLEDDIENKDEQIYRLNGQVQMLEREAREAKAELLRTSRLIKFNQDNVEQLLKKMGSQDKFIERLRDRNGARQHVIDSMVIKLDKAYDELGRLPNWGNYPRKKERWDREEEEDHTALDSIENDMQHILRDRDSEMFRSARHKIAQEPARNSRDPVQSSRQRDVYNVHSGSSTPRSSSVARPHLMSPVMDKENRPENNSTFNSPKRK